MRKYPGTSDFETIANSLLPTNARSDTEDVRIVYPVDWMRQEAVTIGSLVVSTGFDMSSGLTTLSSSRILEF